MSKAQARGKPKQSNVNPKKPTNEVKAASLIEIVPGKFNENDWNNMLEVEDSQEFVWELIDEIFDSTQKIIHEKYLDKQTIPYTIDEAKKAILTILDWQFLSKDEDDDLTEVWVEDEEPEACVIDSWAQGYVQSVKKVESTPVNSKIESSRVEEVKKNFLEELNRIIGDEAKRATPKKDKTPEPVVEKSKKIEEFKQKKKKLDSLSRRVLEPPSPEPEIKKTVPREKNFVSEIKKLEEPISKAPVACQSLLKTLLSRPLALREIEIDSNGNIQSLAKLDLEKSTVNNVKARFSIISEPKPITTIDLTNKKKRPINQSVQEEEKTLSPRRSLRFLPSKRKGKSHHTEEENDYLLEPAPGVVFTMLNTTRSGPKRPNVSNKQNILLERAEHHLKPVKQFNYDSNSITRSSIEEILNNSSSINKFKPIPPISPSTIVN